MKQPLKVKKNHAKSMGSTFQTFVPFFSIESHNIIMALAHILFIPKEDLTSGFKLFEHMPLKLHVHVVLNLGV